jgi:hypothetical protein
LRATAVFNQTPGPDAGAPFTGAGPEPGRGAPA